MLAYEPGTPVGYDISLTILSLLLACLITGVGFATAVYFPRQWGPAAGGAVVGGGVGVMHYLGMYALQTQGHIHWSWDLVAASVLLGCLFGMAALYLAAKRQDRKAMIGAGLLLTLAIVSHHFVAMGAVAAFSPALSANMLNVWQMVAEAYRHGDEQLSTVNGPHWMHALAGVLGAIVLAVGVWAIARRADRRPFSLTALYLFALGSILLPNVYTRAHDNHLFLGLVLLVPLVALLSVRRAWLAGVVGATMILQGFNSWAIYGFGSLQLSFDHPFVDLRADWTWGVRFAAAAVSVALFVAMVVLLRPLAGPRGDAERTA